MFENVGFSFSCGRTKTEFKNAMMSYIIQRTLCKGSYRIYIVSSFVRMSKNDLNTPQRNAYFLENGEENPKLLRSIVSR